MQKKKDTPIDKTKWLSFFEFAFLVQTQVDNGFSDVQMVTTHTITDSIWNKNQFSMIIFSYLLFFFRLR